MIPSRDDAWGPYVDDRARSRERPMVERAINRLKRHRRIATRDGKLAISYLAMVTIACILEWL